MYQRKAGRAKGASRLTLGFSAGAVLFSNYFCRRASLSQQFPGSLG